MLMSDISKLTKNEIMVIEDILESVFDAGVCAWDGDRYRIAYFDFIHSLSKGELRSYVSAVKKLTGQKLETGKKIRNW